MTCVHNTTPEYKRCSTARYSETLLLYCIETVFILVLLCNWASYPAACHCYQHYNQKQFHARSSFTQEAVSCKGEDGRTMHATLCNTVTGLILYFLVVPVPSPSHCLSALLQIMCYQWREPPQNTPGSPTLSLVLLDSPYSSPYPDCNCYRSEFERATSGTDASSK
jgi:hypothetical protein